MTSLAKQLQRLALPQAQVVFGEDKQKASILFDPKEAALIDRETFHALGTNGLEELETLDSAFQEFENSLFGDSSLTFERSVQTKEVNDKLDVTIKRFLIRVSPYCLLKPTHKALEWLVHRFHIHFSNTDDLLLCFLPYHESKIFVRILQLIRFDTKLASKWDWLEPLQKSGVHLSRLTLVNQCSTNPAFLSFLCDMVPAYVKVLSESEEKPKCRVLLSFYCTTVIGVLDTGAISETMLATMLPHLSRGLQSHILEYKAATYMILAQLFHKTHLKTSLLKTLLHVISKSLVTELITEAIACLLLMFQTQDMSSLQITKKAFKYLCQHFSIVDAIAQLYSHFDGTMFLSCLLERLIPAAFKHAVGIATSGESSQSESSGGLHEYMPMLHGLLSTIKLPDDVAEQAAYKLLSVYIRHGNKYLDNHVDDVIKDSLQGIVRQLEGRHSSAVDRAVSRTLSERENEQDRALVQEFLNLYVLSVPHQLVTDSETSLVLSLNHRLASVRQKAVSTLIDSRDQLEDETFLKDSLLARITDEDQTVVLACLSVGQEIWTILEDDSTTLILLQKVLLKGIANSNWVESAKMAAEILGAYTGELTLTVFMACLPCFFLSSWSTFNIELHDILLASSLFKQIDFMKAIAKAWKTRTKKLPEENIGHVNVQMAKCLAVGFKKVLRSEKDLETLKLCTVKALEGKDRRTSCLMLLVLDELVTMLTDVKLRFDVCYIQLQLIDNLQKKEFVDTRDISSKDVGDSWPKVIKEASKKMKSGHTVPRSMCMKALHGVVSFMTVPEQLTDESQIWQLTGTDCEVDVFLKLSVLLYTMLLESSGENEMSRHLLHLLNKMCFKDMQQHFKFLGLLWTQHANDHANDLGLTLILQARSLQVGLAMLMQNLTQEEAVQLVKSPSLISSLLVVLTSSHAPIRETGLKFARKLLSMAEEDNSVFLPLLKKTKRCEGEVLSDQAYIQQVVRSVFKSTSLSNNSKAVTSSKKAGSRARKSSGGNEEVKDNKQSSLALLLSVISGEKTPSFLQHKLLDIFTRLNNKDVLESLLPLLGRLVHQDTPTRTESQCLNLLIQRFTVDTSECLVPKSQGLTVYMKALQTARIHDDNEQTNSQIVATAQMSKELYEALDAPSQHQILCTMFDVSVDSKQLAVTTQLRKTIKHLSVDGSHIETELKKCLKLSTAKTVREAKKQKRAEPTPENVGATSFDSRNWQRVVIILEAVQNKKKIRDYHKLVPVCFQILSSILESDEHTSAEYIKQLILTLLYNICSRLDKQEENIHDLVAEQQFNMELIVNCIRSSENPQTHHHVLLLLTAAAKIYPEHLLHNMMSVFTFMGANIMRQDDAYSFHIIGKLLETVVPALITACEQRKRVPKGITNDLEDIITMMIQVFVDSYPYIPEHRRHLLFNKLLTVIGEKQYLCRLVLLMMKLVVTKGTLKTELALEAPELQPGSSLPSTDTEFCLLLCADFTSAIQLPSATQMLQYILSLPDDKDDDAPVKPRKSKPQTLDGLHKDDAAIFNVHVYTGKQLRHFKYATVNLLVGLFANTDFISQITQGGDADLHTDVQHLLETVLKAVSHFTRMANKSSAKPTAKFWKSLQHKAHDMLDKLVLLLPETMFIDVIGGLLSHDLLTIQRKAMDLLNTKLQQQKDMDANEAASIVPLVKQLLEHVKKFTRAGDTSEETSVNCQTAFISLKLLCRNIGFEHRAVFIQVLQSSVEVFKSETAGLQVASCALLCIAEICSTLKVHVIQHLPTFVTALIDVMVDRQKLLENDLYLMSVITTVNKVVENLSHFLSPYLHDILCNICILSSKTETYDILQKPAVQMRLKTIRSTLSTHLPTRVLLPAVRQCYTHLVNTSKMGVLSLMSLFGDHIAHIAREDLTSHLKQLQDFFLRCLDIRTEFPDLSSKKLKELEGVAIETIIAMVLKLSESSFKPFLFKVFDWATANDDNKDRILVFYRLAERLSERLKSLFTLFAGHIISHAASMLDSNNSFKSDEKFFPSDKSKHKKSCELLEYILDCVNKCCTYDTQGFINKERFDLLMQPLVDQLENEHGGVEVYNTRVKEHLVPCIVQLCVAAQDDSLWRALNYQVCLKSRCQSAMVKESSLNTLDSLHKKLGEEYMPLLPDTIPFLAELMEDESEEVEKKCHEVIKDMEKTLGEPLQKYF